MLQHVGIVMGVIAISIYTLLKICNYNNFGLIIIIIIIIMGLESVSASEDVIGDLLLFTAYILLLCKAMSGEIVGLSGQIALYRVLWTTLR